MTESPDNVKKSIGELLRELFDIRRQRLQLQNEYLIEESKRKDVFAIEDAPLAKRQAKIVGELHTLITNNKGNLLTGKLKSFAMTYGKVAFKAKRLVFKIADKKAVEKLARKDGILNTVGKFERVWKPDAKALEAWLAANPGKAKKYAPFVEKTGGYDEVFAQPNGAYLTEFDPNRLTAEGIKLEKEEPTSDIPDA